MSESTGGEGRVIVVGSALAILLLASGTFVGGSLVGFEPSTLAFWVLAATFGVLTAISFGAGRPDRALAYAGAAVGWVLVLIADEGPWTALGLGLLVLSAAYVAVLTRRDGERAASQEAG